MVLGRASPDPGLGANIELHGGDTGGLLDLRGVGKALTREGIAAEEPPPAFLQIEPARSRGNEDVMEVRMVFQPGTRLEAAMAAEIVGDDEDVPSRIIGLDVGKQGDVALGVA